MLLFSALCIAGVNIWEKQPCSQCGGDGEICIHKKNVVTGNVETNCHPCSACDGKGYKMVKRTSN